MLFPPQTRVFRRLWMCRSYSSLQGLSGPPTLLLCAAAEQTTRNVEAQVGSLLCVLPCPGAQPLSGLSVCLPLWVCVSPAPSPSFLQRQDSTSLLTHFLGKRLFDPCPLLSGLPTSLPGLGPQPHWGGRLGARSLALSCAHHTAEVPCGESAGLGLREAALASVSF